MNKTEFLQYIIETKKEEIEKHHRKINEIIKELKENKLTFEEQNEKIEMSKTLLDFCVENRKIIKMIEIQKEKEK